MGGGEVCRCGDVRVGMGGGEVCRCGDVRVGMGGGEVCRCGDVRVGMGGGEVWRCEGGNEMRGGEDPGVYHMSIFLASHVSRPYLPPPNSFSIPTCATPLLPSPPLLHSCKLVDEVRASGRGAGSEGREQAVVPAACLSGSGHSHRHWRAAGLLAVEASVVFAWSACMHMVSPSQLHACTRAHGTGTFHSHCHCWHGQCMNGSRVVHGRCKACMMHHARIASHMQLLFTSPHQVVEGTDPAEVTFESIQKPLGCRTTFHLSPHQVVEGTDPAEVTFESIQKPLGCRTTFHLSPHQVVEGTDPAEVTFESIQKPLGCRTTFHLSPHQVVEGTDPAELRDELKEALPRAPKQQLVGALLHDEGLVGALMNAQ
ncbi:unnamed protein product [Closterium sp. NIES-65]|nr:unnamed protein product [Closterium sp. NIES-65]